MGVARNVRLTVPHFVAIGHILRATSMVATVPEKMAQSMAEPFGLAYGAHPARLPQVAINLFWHTRVHRDPANQWLRALLADLFAEAA
ncbi:MAG: PCP degradation transcriptional activation protein [Paracidovorax wautersii]|uniref:PCP degradation transcriptional activation protein n=1 Tax=Paracidovorax wautersii TaxID=1177982 RepID=A0A7V8FNR5_9BURK|nr:MAG: PCP degradation transcriptional activation protein [Paracidovorax wautersii]